MSTWRNLMTPLYEKFYQESQSSGLSVSKSNFSSRMAKDSRITNKSPKIDLKNGSVYNERIIELKNEMTKLKTELAKHPKNLGNSSITTAKKDAYFIDENNTKNKAKLKEEEKDSYGFQETNRTNMISNDFKIRKTFSEKRLIQKLDNCYEQLQQNVKTVIKKQKNLENDINVTNTFRENVIHLKSSLCGNNNTIDEEESINISLIFFFKLKIYFSIN